MSIHPSPIDPVPDQTIQVARAAFPKGNPYLTLRDQLGVIFHDDDFVDLYPAMGQPGLSPWRLAWVTILQFREALVGVQGRRIDEGTPPDFCYSLLLEGLIFQGS